MSPQREISLIAIAPDGTVERKFMPDSLEALQAAVGGYIEYVPRCRLDSAVVGIVNEEGKCLGLAPNPHASELFPAVLAAGDVLCGTVLLALQQGDALDSYPACALDLVALAAAERGEDATYRGRRLRVADPKEDRDG